MHNSFTVASVNKNKPRKNVCGPRVKSLRLRQGWSVDRLAAAVTAMGVPMDAATLRRIEARERTLFDRDILVLAKCLRTTTHRLVTGRDPKTVQ